jgi:hypothetical protein
MTKERVANLTAVADANKNTSISPETKTSSPPSINKTSENASAVSGQGASPAGISADDAAKSRPQQNTSTSSQKKESNSGLIFIVVAVIGLFVAFKILRYAARRRFLISKYGLEVGLRILGRKIWQGMTAEQLLDSWGQPADIGRQVYKVKTKETWKYNQDGKNRYKDRIFLEDGYVVGWQDR